MATRRARKRLRAMGAATFVAATQEAGLDGVSQFEAIRRFLHCRVRP